MRTLITPTQVAELAFRAPDFITAEAVPTATILAAQHKFIRPVLGKLYDALCEDRYPELLAEYVVPPLALYVKLLMLPSLAVQAGSGGVVEIEAENLARAGEIRLHEALCSLRSDAATLMHRAVEHIEADSASYPEYDPKCNVLNRVSMEGGIILNK
jgi:hypothetical protein